MEKRTQKVVLMEILGLKEIQANEEYRELIQKKIEQVEKKASYKNTAPTKTQLANEGFKTEIIEILERMNCFMSITEIKENSDSLKDFTPQKMSALLTQLFKDNKIQKKTEKGKTLFSIA